MTPIEILQKYWKYDKFKNQQEEIINTILGDNDTLVSLPTGAGKSICFQIPALIKEGVCIVVCPTVAIIIDQVNKLKSNLIQATYISANMTIDEIGIKMDNCRFNKIKFLYITPERLNSTFFIEKLKQININFIVVDEAHCISTWGYDFRPSYLNISILRGLFINVPIAALTATATHNTKLDIQQQLKMANPIIFNYSLLRENIIYLTKYVKEENKNKTLIDIIKKINGHCIVYVKSRQEAINTSSYINTYNLKTTYYHAGINNRERENIQNDWLKNKYKVIVATKAFGMGVDKPNVKGVIHTYISESIETYYQESGRAGRDGKKSYAILLYNENDIKHANDLLELENPNADYIKRVYQHLCNHIQLAIGSQTGQTYKVDLQELAKKYKTQYNKLKKAAIVLEREGLIKANLNNNEPSTIQFTATYNEIYNILINENDKILSTILKIYNFENLLKPCLIIEAKIAKLINMSEIEVIKRLTKLNDLKILQYKSNQTTITFITPRYNINKLPIDEKRLELIKVNSMHRLEGIINYAENSKICRNKIILNYFGEHPNDNCNTCDICIKKHNNS